MRKIYKAALKTVIWLRELSARSKQCFRSLASPNVADLFVLGCPQWWSRVWVIQELVVSKNAVLKAGLDKLPWSKREFPTKEMKWALALNVDYSLFSM